MRPCIRSQERKSVTETFSQARFQSVIAGIRDTGDLADRTVDATTGWVWQRASGIETPLIRVARGGNRTRLGRRRTAWAGSVHAGDVIPRIPFNEGWQPPAGGTHVS